MTQFSSIYFFRFYSTKRCALQSRDKVKGILGLSLFFAYISLKKKGRMEKYIACLCVYLVDARVVVGHCGVPDPVLCLTVCCRDGSVFTDDEFVNSRLHIVDLGLVRRLHHVNLDGRVQIGLVGGLARVDLVVLTRVDLGQRLI